MSKVVGIDLGTTNSLVAYVKEGQPVVIRDRSGDGLVPSVVSAAEDGTIYVGREEQRRLLTDAARTVYSVKRFMGKGIDDIVSLDPAEAYEFSDEEAIANCYEHLLDYDPAHPETIRALERSGGIPVLDLARLPDASSRLGQERYLSVTW